tara:strand:- start:143 stop:286 length:144 start_codon:yes stop_codon:yes gene_type:complete
MYIVYEEHIEQLEEENADLKQEVVILRQRLEYYKKNTIDINDARIDD